MLSLIGHVKEKGYFPQSNLIYHRYLEAVSDEKGLGRSVANTWHQDTSSRYGISNKTPVAAFLNGPRTEDTKLSKANLELANGNQKFYEADKKRGYNPPPIIVTPRDSNSDTVMAVVNNTELFHRGNTLFSSKSASRHMELSLIKVSRKSIFKASQLRKNTRQ